MQSKRYIIFLAAIFFFALRASATDVAPSKDLFRFDDVVEISAPVTGDLYAMGREIILHGHVAGDVLAVGQSVTVEGPVAGNVRIIAETVRVTGDVGGNVSVAASALALGEKASVAKNVAFVGQSLAIASHVAGDVQSWMIDPRETRIQPSAVIDGMVSLHSAEEPIVEQGALLRHTIERTPPADTTSTFGDVLFGRIIAFFSLFLVGLVVIHLLQRPSLVIVSLMHGQPHARLLVGLAVLALIPLLAVALLFTVIGIPLGVILLMLWTIIFYTGRVFAALAIGLAIVRFDRGQRIRSLVVVLLFGTLALITLESIPFIGMAVMLIASAWGAGGVARLLYSFSEGPKKT
ncbi:hypothetical protein HY625_00550 [Candidatus Uhrbacteria bacterium]|nr:hypothetical protein [Candidatus Uhrbacteria bacterium]